MQNECIGLCGNLTQTWESTAELFHACILGLSGNCTTDVIISLAFLPPRVGRETSLYKLFTCRPKGFSFSAILVSKWAYVNFRSCSLLELQIIVSRSSDNLQLKYLLTICCGLLLLPGILISRHQLFKRWIVLSDGEISIQGIGQLVFVWQSGTYPVELTRQRLNMFNMPNVWQIPEVEALIQAF